MKDLVEQIHNEFYTSAEMYVKEMEPKLTGYDSIKVRADRLRAVGFSNASATVEEWQYKVEAEKVDAYYKAKIDYPAHKFITKEMVDNICEKYNLIWGPVENYISDIPEKNLIDIEQFQGKFDTNLYDRRRGWFGGWKEGWRPTLFDRWRLSMKPMLTDWHGYGVKRRRSSLTICASRTDMTLDGFQRIEGHRIIDNPIPDPVVLHQIENGYIIVTAWGPEASDPEVVNESYN